MTSSAGSEDNNGSIGRLAELIGGNPIAHIDTDMKAVLDMMGQLAPGRSSN